jgi:hypothetical protein
VNPLKTFLIIAAVFIAIAVIFSLAKKETPEADSSETPLSSAEAFNELEKIVVYLDDFYEGYKDYTYFAAQGGYLCEFPDGERVTVKNFYTEGLELDERAEIMALKTSDAERLLNSKLEYEGIYKPCAAFKVRDGVAIAASAPDGVKIALAPKEEFEAVVSGYACEFGYVEGAASSPAKFKKIVEAIENHLGVPIDARSVSKDERFALAVVSPKTDSSDISQFILELSDGEWRIALAGVEDALKPYLYVNERLLNFNLRMLPKYSIRKFELFGESDEMVAAIKTKGYAADDDEITFFSGADEYIYMEFASGKNFIANRTSDGLWMIYPVSSYEEAMILALSLDENAPVFILKQNI